MIAFIEGKIVHKDPTHVVLETSGIGYEIKISLNTFSTIRDETNCKLLTHLSIKEDAHTLYGFHEMGEKKLFLDLISISGVGPSTALMMLSSMGVSELKQSIAIGDVRSVKSIKGIGEKTAQRIILELKEKMTKESGLIPVTSDTSLIHNSFKSEALHALLTLGFQKPAAEKAIEAVMKKEGTTTITVEQLIKSALKQNY
jgi:holliday junction DNA helicase RuvA